MIPRSPSAAFAVTLVAMAASWIIVISPMLPKNEPYQESEII